MSIELELAHYGVKGMRWGAQALGVIPANSVIKDRAHAAETKVYNKVRKTSIDGIRSAARMAAERQRHKDFYDQFRAAGIKI